MEDNYITSSMPTKILTKALFHLNEGLNEDWLKKKDEEGLLVRIRNWAMWIVDREVGAGPVVAVLCTCVSTWFTSTTRHLMYCYLYLCWHKVY